MQDTPAYSQVELSAANYRDWKQGSTVFEASACITARRESGRHREPLRVEGTAVSFDLFPTLRVSR
jgi:hypothetical protein